MGLRIEFAGRTLGEGCPVFLVAEAGVNHDGNLAQALALVDAAAECGADAVKFQTFRASALCSLTAPKAGYQEAGTPGESQHAMLSRLELSAEAHVAIAARAREKGILFLSSPFDESSADFLERLCVPAFKIPSGELTNLGFLAHVARKKKPMLVSTGMASLDEIERALATISAGAAPVALFHCTSAYPARLADANLRAMATLSNAFHVPVGYSDHTPGIEVSLAAAALGAALIEKHLTLDRTLAGPDHSASLGPAEWKRLARGVRNVERALGSPEKRPTESEQEIARVARKSLFAARALSAGQRLEHGDTIALRPGTGISPARLSELLGLVLKTNVPAGAALAEEHFE